MSRRIRWRRVAYDVASVQAKIRAVGLPERMQADSRVVTEAYTFFFDDCGVDDGTHGNDERNAHEIAYDARDTPKAFEPIAFSREVQAASHRAARLVRDHARERGARPRRRRDRSTRSATPRARRKRQSDRSRDSAKRRLLGSPANRTTRRHRRVGRRDRARARHRQRCRLVFAHVREWRNRSVRRGPRRALRWSRRRTPLHFPGHPRPQRVRGERRSVRNRRDARGAEPDDGCVFACNYDLRREPLG